MALLLFQATGEVRLLEANGPGSRIDLTTGQTFLELLNTVTTPNPSHQRGVLVELGGEATLNNATITLGPGPGPGSPNRGIDVDEPGSTMTATNTIIIGQGGGNLGVFAFHGGTASIGGTKSIITMTGDGGYGIASQTSLGDHEVTIMNATNTTISVTGNNNDIVAAYFTGATTNVTNSTITGSGTGNNPLIAFFGGVVNVTNSPVTSTGSHAALVDAGGVLNVVGSTISGDINGIEISDDVHTFGPDTVALTSSKLTNNTGAAFKVEAADVNITVTNSTVDSGAQHTLLDVTGTVPTVTQLRAIVSPNVTAPVARAQTPFNSLVILTSSSSTLNGDILVDANSNANVMLEHNSVLTGAINENSLTGATGINPAEQVTNPISPTFPPFTVDLGIDSTSTWNMRTSSTLNTLTVNPGARINIADPPTDPFKTLLVNNLIGTGGIFKLNNDLAAIKGDLIEILTKSEGVHLLTFNNRTTGSDLPVNTALLVVRTPDGGAGFTGQEDGGTFRYFVVHGDGSSVTPVKNDWYLVRGDEITPPEVTEPPPTNPNPTPTPPPTGGPTPPQFAPGDNLPLPPEPPPVRLSRINDLTSGANAAIGTFAATIPLFYADMDTLIQRLGELRLQAQEAPPPTTPIPSGTSKEGGKEVVAPLPVVPPGGGGVWFRGFGSGSHIDDQVSRSFHQNLGGFQIGADKRLVTHYGDLYLGGFVGYFYAHRDFQNPQPINDATGTTNAFSLGAYSTLIHPSGFYADLVVKYTQLWNDFDAPNFLSTLGLGSTSTANYSIPTFGASLQIGKRWDFGHFFVEPQGQIEGAWADSTSYTVSTGLRVNADSQTSLRGRLGLRAGYHIDCGSKAFEPYAKVSVINEFLGGDRITTNQTTFFPTLSGVGIQAAGGVTARITDSAYLYGEYDYANSDKLRIPWAVDAGFRWVW
jgi:outer membrane autotransporter protein